MTPARRRRGNSRIHLQRLRAHARVLRTVYTGLAEDLRHGEPAAPAAEWLLDNFHLISATIRDIRHDVPPSFYRRLPILADDEFAGLPRICALALELVRSSAGRLDAQRLQRFIIAFQSVTPLTIGELWAWPSALKLAIVEHLRVRADILAERRAHRLSADQIANGLERPQPPHSKWPSSIHPAFVTRLLLRSQEYGATAAALRQQLDAALTAAGQTVEDAIRSEGQHQATEQAAMANLVGSIRLVSTFDWSEFFESVSLVEQVLQRDPAGIYGRMDFRSRDRYRHAVEELADPTGEAQLRVALKSVERARQVAERTPDARGAHVGYHLIGRGREAFEKGVAWAPGPTLRARRLFFRHATIGYLGSIAAGTAALITAALLFVYGQGWSAPLLLALVALLIVLPATELTIQFVQRIVSYLIPPRRLPRLEFDQIPASARTMVIVPTILNSVERVAELMAHLEVQAIGNLDSHVHFAFLSDFPDAPAETTPQDAEIVEAARAGIDALNAKYAGEAGSRFHLFHRRRQWNEREGLWMGWERKRGKIEEFNRLLRGATDTSFSTQVGDVSILQEVRYCITLDSDTRLPRNVARELIGVITHPLNRPTIDPASGRVTEGYGVLQPRVSVTFMSAAGSLFARLYSGHTGVDPYTTAVSDTYQDLFGEGIFTGKGLYDVDAFMASIGDSVPENALLSHDLFEGLHARAALVSDIELVDEYPSSVVTHARRQHRWIRGDWQILFWLFPFVPSRRGWIRNSLPLIARWKIFDNLRRSLVTPALLMLLLAGWTVLPGSHWVWTAAALAVLLAQIFPVLAQLLRGPRASQSIPVFLGNLRDDAATALAQALLSVTFLAYHAYQTAHAIGLTLVRLVVTKRRLLEWETAATATARAAGLVGRRGLRRFTTDMMSSPVIAAVAAVAIAAIRPDALGLAAPFLLLWIAAPAVAYWLSVPSGPAERAHTDQSRTLVRRTARLTWRYFETFVTEADSWLPPDNYQEEGNQSSVARRTSPTNIGMSLLSTLAAHDLGYLSTAALVRRLDRTLTTLEGLERFQGHFLNWYDTSTRAPLHPRYVSTVDSGNLAAALIALTQGLTDLARAPQTRPQLLDGIVDTASLLARASSSTRSADRLDRQTLTEVNRLAHGILLVARGDGEPDQLRALSAQLQEIATAIGREEPPDTTTRDVAFWCQAAMDGIANVLDESEPAPATLHDLASRASAIVDGMRFEFLYDHRRRIFSVGFRLADAEGPGRLDTSFY
ncbi:MAG: hypothetical protein AB7P22_17410, partial [Vicinamibacterales bacterium]